MCSYSEINRKCVILRVLNVTCNGRNSSVLPPLSMIGVSMNDRKGMDLCKLMTHGVKGNGYNFDGSNSVKNVFWLLRK